MEKHTGSLCTNPHVSQMVFFSLTLLFLALFSHPFFPTRTASFIFLFSMFSISASIAVSSQPLFCMRTYPHTITRAADAVLCLSRRSGVMNELWQDDKIQSRRCFVCTLCVHMTWHKKVHQQRMSVAPIMWHRLAKLAFTWWCCIFKGLTPPYGHSSIHLVFNDCCTLIHLWVRYVWLYLTIMKKKDAEEDN